MRNQIANVIPTHDARTARAFKTVMRKKTTVSEFAMVRRIAFLVSHAHHGGPWTPITLLKHPPPADKFLGAG